MNIDLAAYDTDKSQAYLARYEREFGHLFEQPIALLELGVQRGGSMYLWRDLLPHAQIAGLDLNEIPIQDDTRRLHIYQGFQQDPAILDRIAAEIAPGGFDVIIDDASHLGKYTAESFWHLFPNHLKPGGIYVIDDWGSAYWPEWADGHAYTGSRESLGDFSTVSPLSRPNRIEELRRRVRASARPMAATLPPSARQRLERLYMRIEGASVQRRFQSHNYGMAGFVKQLVDACAIRDIDRNQVAFDNQIESVNINSSQVFVHKRVAT
jgi:SAM-dependent methyltransferase